MHLNGGWKIKKISQRQIAKGHPSKNYSGVPKIIESTLIATNGSKKRTIKHLHYTGWKDKRAAPSVWLMDRLQNRMKVLSPNPETPIAINCRGGIGRTGTLATSYVLRKKINEKILKGKPLKKIRVNIPDTIYSFRKQRNGLVGNEIHLSQIYSITHAYYEKLQRHKAIIKKVQKK